MLGRGGSEGACGTGWKLINQIGCFPSACPPFPDIQAVPKKLFLWLARWSCILSQKHGTYFGARKQRCLDACPSCSSSAIFQEAIARTSQVYLSPHRNPQSCQSSIMNRRKKAAEAMTLPGWSCECTGQVFPRGRGCLGAEGLQGARGRGGNHLHARLPPSRHPTRQSSPHMPRTRFSQENNLFCFFPCIEVHWLTTLCSFQAPGKVRYIYICFRLLSLIGYYKILNVAPYAIP